MTAIYYYSQLCTSTHHEFSQILLKSLCDRMTIFGRHLRMIWSFLRGNRRRRSNVLSGHLFLNSKSYCQMQSFVWCKSEFEIRIFKPLALRMESTPTRLSRSRMRSWYNSGPGLSTRLRLAIKSYWRAQSLVLVVLHGIVYVYMTAVNMNCTPQL